jgi:hypothetical protein
MLPVDQRANRSKIGENKRRLLDRGRFWTVFYKSALSFATTVSSYLPRFGGLGNDSFGRSARFGISGLANRDGVGCCCPFGGLGSFSFGRFRPGAIGGSGAGIVSLTGLPGKVRHLEIGRTEVGGLGFG